MPFRREEGPKPCLYWKSFARHYVQLAAMDRLKTYLKAQMEPFDHSALWSPKIAKEGAWVVFWWAIPAFALVLLVANYKEYLPSVYLEAAISEGIGPHLWNVIGTLGLVLVGVALIFPRSKFIAKSAHQILINTYAIGGLSFGLLSGQLAAALPTAWAKVATWKAWLIGAGGIFLVLQVLLLNFSLWYLGHLMASRENSDGFLHRVERVAIPVRLAAFALFAVLPVALLFLEK